MTEPLFVQAHYANGAGTTMREAQIVDVAGRALMGPTTFPMLQPKLNAGEKLKWRPSRGGWAIATRTPRR